MKKISTLAAVAALALAAAAPVAADTAVQSDPFVSSQQGGFYALNNISFIGGAVGLVAVVAFVSASGT